MPRDVEGGVLSTDELGNRQKGFGTGYGLLTSP